jgi:hypothetical protein
VDGEESLLPPQAVRATAALMALSSCNRGARAGFSGGFGRPATRVMFFIF